MSAQMIKNDHNQYELERFKYDFEQKISRIREKLTLIKSVIGVSSKLKLCKRPFYHYYEVLILFEKNYDDKSFDKTHNILKEYGFPYGTILEKRGFIFVKIKYMNSYNKNTNNE